MDDTLITIGSTTSAMRLARLIRAQTHCRAEIMHTPSELNRGGCSYSIRTERSAVGHARQIAEKYKLPFGKVYRIQNINGERVYNALS
jgi:hypothetical protein